MAKWIEDPQGRLEVEKVTEEIKLPVWKANYKGKFREFWNECWDKIENSFFWGIILISVLLSIYLITTMLFYQSLDKLSLISAINFIRHFNFILSVLAVASCLMSYNRSKKENIFDKALGSLKGFTILLRSSSVAIILISLYK